MRRRWKTGDILGGNGPRGERGRGYPMPVEFYHMSGCSPILSDAARGADVDVDVDADAAPAGVTLSWQLRKNCSFTPRQVMLFYGSLTVVSFAIALFFALRGLWLVLPFTVLDNVVLAIALLYYARHALDRECVSLQGDRLRVDVCRAQRVTSYCFNADWARLEWSGRRNEVLWLCHGDQRVRVGTFLAPPRRRRFARELRHALRTRRR